VELGGGTTAGPPLLPGAAGGGGRSSRWWWPEQHLVAAATGALLGCDFFIVFCNLCRVSVLAHDEFLMRSEILCRALNSAHGKAIAVHVAWQRFFCRAAFVVRFREKRTAKALSCVFWALPCARNAQQTAGFP
jgi:hypothetical protein